MSDRAAEVHLAPMRRRDLRSVARIEQQVYPRPWSAALFLGELARRSDRVYLVARVGRRVVGYAGLMLVAGDGHVTTIAVDPAWQRRRVATRLLVALARRAREGGLDALTLEVRVSNRAAQSLYRRFGFEVAGVRTGYYADNSEDAVVMWARDLGSAEYGALLDRHEAALGRRDRSENLA